MKKPVVDYRKLRLNNLNSPEFSHVKLLFGWVGYFILFFLTENLIPYEKCHVIHIHLDDLIPFMEIFVIPYCIWFLLVVGSLLYYFLYDIPRFRQLQTFIIITQIIAMIVYICYPSIQDLRPEVFPRENFFTWVLGLIYTFDTPTGVFPSLHVAYSFGIASVICKDDHASKWVKAGIVLLALIISAATCFVKQHSAADVFAGAAVGLFTEILVFGKSYWAVKIKKKKP